MRDGLAQLRAIVQRMFRPGFYLVVGANDITALPVCEHPNIRLLRLKAKAGLALSFRAYAVIGDDFLLHSPIIRFCHIIPNGR